MKTLLLLCLVTASSAVSAAEHSESGPRASPPQELDYRPVHREALPEGHDRSRWVEAVRVAFQPLREKSSLHGAHKTPRGH